MTSVSHPHCFFSWPDDFFFPGETMDQGLSFIVPHSWPIDVILWHTLTLKIHPKKRWMENTANTSFFSSTGPYLHIFGWVLVHVRGQISSCFSGYILVVSLNLTTRGRWRQVQRSSDRMFEVPAVRGRGCKKMLKMSWSLRISGFLFGALEHFYFPIYWEESSQLTFIFFRGVQTTNQIYLYLWVFFPMVRTPRSPDRMFAVWDIPEASPVWTPSRVMVPIFHRSSRPCLGEDLWTFWW